jgi:ubiquinone/menaquinone biosynthesis C-methylase UbiE
MKDWRMSNTEEERGREQRTNIGYWEQVLRDPTPAYAELFEREQEFLLKNISEGSEVLDLGCGEGRNMETISRRTSRVTGVDNDENAVQLARGRFLENPDVCLVCGGITELPFQDESFDMVTLSIVLGNLDQQKEAALKEIVRILKKDGIFLVSVFAETASEERMKIYRRVGVKINEVSDQGKFVMEDGKIISEQFSLEEMRDMLSMAGFEIELSDKVGDLAYLIKAKKVQI